MFEKLRQNISEALHRQRMIKETFTKAGIQIRPFDSSLFQVDDEVKTAMQSNSLLTLVQLISDGQNAVEIFRQGESRDNIESVIATNPIAQILLAQIIVNQTKPEFAAFLDELVDHKTALLDPNQQVVLNEIRLMVRSRNEIGSWISPGY